nr:putative transporter [Quercus suber]
MSTPTGDQAGRQAVPNDAITSIAGECIARDLEDTDVEAMVSDDHNGQQQEPAPMGQHSMAGQYRRPSYIATTPRPFLGAQQPETLIADDQEREAAISEERSLLRDNNLIPAKTSRRRSSQASYTSGRGLLSMSFGQKQSARLDQESLLESNETHEPTETSALLEDGISANPDDDHHDSASDIDKKWEEAVRNGEIKTTWQRESKVLARYSAPLILTFVLQQSLTLTSVFTVGHIGRNELGAVSLGTMTANITGYAVYHGLATSLDTLCPQAYGSGKKKLVGLQLQRMVYFLWTITIPIACIWLAGSRILAVIVPEKEIAELAGLYLKILILGAPGYACFESAKRFVQAQGRFEATLYVLLIAAPLNMLMHYLFVWRLEWGFIGCPIAVVITENLMPLLLFLYVRFVGGMECWPGFSKKALTNWGPMVRLALPGFVMVIAEFLAFEILTLASARISATHLAANTVLQSLCIFTYQFPFPISIAASTRVANLIGAGLPDAAKVTVQVTFVVGTVIGLINMVVLSSLRGQIPRLFSSDADVIALAAATLPLNAAFQLFDSLAAQGNGLLRGLGKQEAGGYINLFAYYVIAMPISFGTGFGLHWDLNGLWLGPAIALGLVSGTVALYIYRIDWNKAAAEAAARNAAG